MYMMYNVISKFFNNINLVVGYNYLLKEEGTTSFICMMNLLKSKLVRVQLYGFFLRLNEEAEALILVG